MNKNKISIIVAVAENNAIGRKNELLCHLSDDLKRFKKYTTDNVIVMGKKTWESLPVKPLPKRENIVLSDNKNDVFKGAITVNSIDDAINSFSLQKENFIIGGGSVYKQFLPFADKLYITKVHHKFDDADTFFPEIKMEEWNILEEEFKASDEKNEFGSTFLLLEKKS